MAGWPITINENSIQGRKYIPGPYGKRCVILLDGMIDVKRVLWPFYGLRFYLLKNIDHSFFILRKRHGQNNGRTVGRTEGQTRLWRHEDASTKSFCCLRHVDGSVLVRD